MTTAITDAELQVFQLLLAAAKDGRASLYRVMVKGEERAALVSLERKPGGGSTLGVFGLLLAPEEMKEIGSGLSGQKLIEPPETRASPELIPVQFPDAESLAKYISMSHADFDLDSMMQKHNMQLDASAGESSDPSADFEVFVNKDDGQTYLAVTMIQLFRKTDDEVYKGFECPFCATELVDQLDGWRECPACKCAWAEDGKFRKGKR